MNQDNKGISINGNEINISQYADDTALILNGSEKSFTAALRDFSRTFQYYFWPETRQ